MEITYGSVIDFTKTAEGPYSSDRMDSGNWAGGEVGHGPFIGSKWGVGAPALISWVGTHAQVTADYMQALTAQMHNALARSRYWRAMGCTHLPSGVDLMVFDHGWNRGDGTSVRLLQSLLGVNIDGDCGEGTLAAVAAYGTPEQLIDDLAAAQRSDYRKLWNFSRYGEGWLNRAAARTKAAHAALASLAPAPVALDASA
ncbi:MAG: glycosyl hydrolase 108 family protein [Janthinobacterium lividum]